LKILDPLLSLSMTVPTQAASGREKQPAEQLTEALSRQGL
jgi:hypothetical protein